MDIVVTIPKSEYKNDDLETKDMINNDMSQFWTMNRIPKNLNINDRVWFVKNGIVESSMRVFGIDKGNNISQQCETTNRLWYGKCILQLDDLQYTDGTIKSKGFQGFRYKWW